MWRNKILLNNFYEIFHMVLISLLCVSLLLNLLIIVSNWVSHNKFVAHLFENYYFFMHKMLLVYKTCLWLKVNTSWFESESLWLESINSRKHGLPFKSLIGIMKFFISQNLTSGNMIQSIQSLDLNHEQVWEFGIFRWNYNLNHTLF